MGAIVASTILSMWIGIGSFVYKYIPTTLPRSIDGCVANTGIMRHQFIFI